MSPQMTFSQLSSFVTLTTVATSPYSSPWGDTSSGRVDDTYLGFGGITFLSHFLTIYFLFSYLLTTIS